MSMSSALKFHFVALVVFAVCWAAPARAGDQRSGDEPGHRGLVAGLSLGGGTTGPCDGGDRCSPSAAGALRLGAMARRDLAILADLSVVRGQNDKPGSLGVAALALQYWPGGGRFWLTAGVGGSRAFDWQEWGDARHVGRRRLTGIAGAGYEVFKGDVFAVDLHVRTAFTGNRHSLATGLGLTWY